MFDTMAVMTTACRRPYYLKESLASWKAARHSEQLRDFVVALGDSPAFSEQLDVIASSGLGAVVVPDRRPGRGMHAPIAETLNTMFGMAGRDFVIATEEDVVVSDDVLEYFAWAAELFKDNQQVLAVCAHSVGGQGWDKHEPAQDAEASQSLVHVMPYFSAWCWGTWRDRWPVLYDQWDFDCTSGGPLDSGWDWNIATRIVPQGGFRCVVPAASRSQNIGAKDGWASTPQSFAFSQAQSFRSHRDPVRYCLNEAQDQA